MNIVQKRVTGAIAASAMLLSSVLPVFAATTVVIEGNGPDTVNTVKVDQENTVGVTQDNYASIHNNIETYASTGDNEVNKATGGNVQVDTGDAEVNVVVANSVNSNTAEVECCDTGEVDLTIAGNGPDTKNLIDLDTSGERGSGVYVTQDNKANVRNTVFADAFTGGNEVNKPTGGDVDIDTGDATTSVVVATSANSNSAYVGGGGAGDLSAWIVGNGPDTKNKIDLDLEHQVLVNQNNYASVHNMVKAGAATGDNEVNKSTGGEVAITTGDAGAAVGIDNAVNFNWASLDCGCLMGGFTYKIAGNGPDSKNLLDINLGGGSWVQQGNVAGSGLTNGIGAFALTGENEVKKSTGSYDGDPAIDTGDAFINAGVQNSGNSNIVGDAMGFGWSEMPNFGEYQWNFGFNWAVLFAWMA